MHLLVKRFFWNFLQTLKFVRPRAKIEKFLDKSNILHTPIYFIFSNFNRIGQFVETRKPKYPIGYCLSTQNDQKIQFEKKLIFTGVTRIINMFGKKCRLWSIEASKSRVAISEKSLDNIFCWKMSGQNPFKDLLRNFWGDTKSTLECTTQFLTEKCTNQFLPLEFLCMGTL